MLVQPAQVLLLPSKQVLLTAKLAVTDQPTKGTYRLAGGTIQLQVASTDDLHSTQQAVKGGYDMSCGYAPANKQYQPHGESAGTRTGLLDTVLTSSAPRTASSNLATAECWLYMLQHAPVYRNGRQVICCCHQCCWLTAGE